jgi:hypothetical protein
VRPAGEVWPGRADAGKNGLCRAWVAQSAGIEEAEKAGGDKAYVAWAGLTAALNAVSAAYAAAGEPGGELAGPAFGARLAGPALAILSGWESLVAWAIKNSGAPAEEVRLAREPLAGAAGAVQALARRDFTETGPIGRGDAFDEEYWGALDGALRTAIGAVATLCPRMMSVRNAATISGEASKISADRCLLLLDGPDIKALAMRALEGTLHIDEITVEPRSLAGKVTGLGGKLMEYLIREAHAARSGTGVSITLLPVGDLAKKYYTTMGFTPGGDIWVMTRPAQQAYLRTHTEFGAAPGPPA